MTFSRFAFAAALVCLSQGQERGIAQDSKPEAAARKSTEQWLALIDAGKYEDSYDAAAEEMKSRVTKEQWVRNFASARSGSGALKSRKLVSATYTESIPNAPAGKYVVLQFDTKFAAGTSTEQAVSIQEKDGTWREVGYVMSPPQ